MCRGGAGSSGRWGLAVGSGGRQLQVVKGEKKWKNKMDISLIKLFYINNKNINIIYYKIIFYNEMI